MVGFDRDAGPSTTIEARSALTSLSRTLDIAPGTFPESRIDGLPPATVEPTDPALLERIKEEAALKAVGFASKADTDDFRDGFVWPLETYRISSLWGAQRILNGTPARPHYGIDLAAPQGTPIRAPADGVVAFSRSGMHFEGGLVLIDHGQGLVSCYLHQSQIDEGPCVDAAQDGGSIALTGEDELRARWPRFGPAMIGSGFLSVHSAPLRWKGSTLGAMALFRRDATPFGPGEDEAAQAFADVVARLVMADDAADVAAATERALESRIVVEQAKGAMMHSEGVRSGEAYEMLLQRAERTGVTLTVAATEVLEGLLR